MISTKSNSVASFLAALTILTAITWALGLLDIQYKTERKLAFESGFPGDPEHWQVSGDPSNITLSFNSVMMQRISEKRSYAMRKFPLPAAAELLDRQLRVRGDITTVKQASKTTIKNVAAYMIWFQNHNDETIKYTTIQALTGDFSHYRAERIVSVPKAARAFVTVLMNRDSDGSFELTNADITVVEPTLLYKLIRPTLFLFWIGIVLLAVIWLVKNGGYKIGVAVSIFLLLTLTGLLIPESVTSNYVLPAYKKFAQLLSLGHSEPLGIYYKIGHFLFFFAVTLTLIINRQRLQLSVWIIMVLMLTFAVATEGLQLHLYSRSTRLSDIGIDLSGVVLAVLLGLGLQSRANFFIRTNIDSTE